MVCYDIIIFIFLYRYNNMSFTNYITHRGRLVATGIKFQCVEFARRWLLIYRDMLFDNVDNAINIWNLNTITRITDNKRFSFASVLHDGSTLPDVGSLLIYRSTPTMQTGHVAVVTRIEHDLIHFDERNGNRFHKTVGILPNGMLDDPEIIGWKTIVV